MHQFPADHWSQAAGYYLNGWPIGDFEHVRLALTGPTQEVQWMRGKGNNNTHVELQE